MVQWIQSQFQKISEKLFSDEQKEQSKDNNTLEALYNSEVKYLRWNMKQMI